jgi:hypothetical protein
MRTFVGGASLTDSFGNTAQSSKEIGFMGTCYTTNKASYGVRLFLNICASYLKAKKRNDGYRRQQFRDLAESDSRVNGEIEDKNTFLYAEPFGSFQ